MPPDPGRAGDGFAGNALSVLAARVVALAAGLLTSITVARVAGPLEQGRYALAMLVATVLVVLVSLGIGPATTYHMARGQRPARVILGNTILFALAAGAAGVMLGALLAATVQSRLLPELPRPYVLLALGMVPTSLLISSFQALFGGLQRFRDWGLITAFHASVNLGSVSVALFLCHAGIPGVLLALAISHALTAAVALRRLAQLAGGVSLRPDAPYLREAIAYAWRAHLGNVLQLVNYRIDLLLLNALRGAEQVGIYSVAVSICEQLWLVPDAAATALVPRVASRDGAADAGRDRKITMVVTRNTLLLAAAGAPLLLLASAIVVPLAWGRAYAPSLVPLAVLLPGAVALAAAKVLAGDILGRGRPFLNSAVAGVGVVVTVAGCLALIPRWGIAGAALASTLAYAVVFGGVLAAHCRLSGHRPAEVLLFRRSDLDAWRQALQRISRSARGA